MPFGHYGDVDIGGKGYHIFFWSSPRKVRLPKRSKREKKGWFSCSGNKAPYPYGNPGRWR